MASTFTSDTLPADHKAAIRQMKPDCTEQLRSQPTWQAVVPILS